MAKAKQPSRAEQIQAQVKVTHQGAAFASILAVNPNFAAPHELDRARGVEYPDAPEIEQAERAVAVRTLHEMVPTSAAGIRLWIALQQRRLGREGLYDKLVEIEPIPPHQGELPKYARGDAKRAYREALKRAIQRSGPPKKPSRIRKEQHNVKGVVKPEYRRRFELLALSQAQVVLGIFGHFVIRDETRGGKEHDTYAWEGTDPSYGTELEDARAIVAAGGLGLVEYVARVVQDHYIGQSGVIELVTLHAVQVQVDAGGGPL